MSWDAASVAVFRKFAAYDFAGDTTFQSGLPRILHTLTSVQGLRGVQLDREVQRFKAFYFSKKVAPLDFEAFAAWERQGAVAATRRGEPVCPFTGAVGEMPASHPPIGEVKHAVQIASEPRCPFAPAAAAARGRPGPAAATAEDHLQLTRARTGLAHLRIVLSDPADNMNPEDVVAIGNHLVTCLFDRTVTALVLSFAIADTVSQPIFDCGRDPSLELWSLARGPLDTPDKRLLLQNELRLVTLLRHVSALLPTIAIVDSPMFGLAVPLMLACRFRVGTQRAELRLGGSSMVGTSLGFFATLPAGMRRYLGLVSKALFPADLCATKLLSDFVPRAKLHDLELALTAAAACPPPHTDKALQKTIKDFIEAPGPSRLRTFEHVIQTVFGADARTDAIAAQLTTLNETPWQQTTLDTLGERAGPLQQFALDTLDRTAALDGNTAAQAAYQYERMASVALSPKVFDDRSSVFDLPEAAMPPASLRVPPSQWLFGSGSSSSIGSGAPLAIDWRALIAGGTDNGPHVLLEQPFYAVQTLQYADEADDVLV